MANGHKKVRQRKHLTRKQSQTVCTTVDSQISGRVAPDNVDEQEASHLVEEEALERTDVFVEIFEDDLDEVLLDLRANQIFLYLYI